MTKIDAALAAAYQTQYDTLGEQEQWRAIGAKYKFRNLQAVTKGRTFRRVLEVGAGDGAILQNMDRTGFGAELYAVEIAESARQRILARQLPRLKQAECFDGYKLPFDDDAFDLVVLSHVLEHVEHERLLLAEIRRVSTHQVIEVPRDYTFDVDKKAAHFFAYGHINMYSPTLLRFLLISSGFLVLDQLLSVTSREVLQFSKFNLQRRPRNFVSQAKINLTHAARQALVSYGPQRLRDRHANAVTVFTQRSDKNLQIFA